MNFCLCHVNFVFMKLTAITQSNRFFSFVFQLMSQHEICIFYSVLFFLVVTMRRCTFFYSVHCLWYCNYCINRLAIYVDFYTFPCQMVYTPIVFLHGINALYRDYISLCTVGCMGVRLYMVVSASLRNWCRLFLSVFPGSGCLYYYLLENVFIIIRVGGYDIARAVPLSARYKTYIVLILVI